MNNYTLSCNMLKTCQTVRNVECGSSTALTKAANKIVLKGGF